MKKFIHKDFLLQSREARILYHDYAEGLPVIDYHNHLPPADIAADRSFGSISDLWLGGDHYKWRAMRTAGIDEELITGNAPPELKFSAWAGTMPGLLRNPLYHWAHLELARYFGIDDILLGPENADYVYEKCNSILSGSGFSARPLLEKMNVELLCTTDDPADSLEHHASFMSDDCRKFTMLPAWRPDSFLKCEDPSALRLRIDRLESASGISISGFDSLVDALGKRHDFFHSMGCRLSDYGLDTVYADDCGREKAAEVFLKLRNGIDVTPQEASCYKSAMLYELCWMDGKSGWTQQFHIGIIRNARSALYKMLGPDCGCDFIGDFRYAVPLARLLDRLDAAGRLAKTVIYPANPADFDIIATMIGCFQEGPVRGKIQLGSGWWFMDQKPGMEAQMNALSNAGLLSSFIGMTTDSRSFLSFPRHEYFRRVLCNLLGAEMKSGLIPRDFALAGSLVKAVCHDNAAAYFGFPGLSSAGADVAANRAGK